MTPAQTKDERWLAWATAGAVLFSTCIRRQYMALVLSADGRLVGQGYNGPPPSHPHCQICPRQTHGATYGDCPAIHAEANALIHSDRTLVRGGTLIVNGPPCWDCGKLICGSGLKRLIHAVDDSYQDWPRVEEMIRTSNIEIVSVR